MSLEKKDWIRAAVYLMAEKSVDAVKVEVLAKRIGVSKGSFYWHFKNRQALLDGILDYWEAETDYLIEVANRAERPLDRLRALFGAIGEEAGEQSEFALDTAVFRWALRDPAIAERVKRVEEKRIRYMQQLLLDDGRPLELANYQAEVLYLAFLGYVDRAGREPSLRHPAAFAKFGRYMLDLLIGVGK